MKKQLLFGAAFIGSFLTGSAQTVLFEDSFESYDDFAIENIGQWTLIDEDGSELYGFQGANFENSGGPFAFIVFNSGATTPPLEVGEDSDWTARTGDRAMASFAATTPPNNDWLISPQIQLGSTGNTLTFWAKNATTQYGLERFKVGVSTTGTDSGDFTIISPGAYVEPEGVEYTQYTYPLDDYAGEQVYIAINCVSPDRFGFLVDDFSVTTTDIAGIEDQLASQISIYPNPASNLVNIANTSNLLLNDITIADINGRTVKSMRFDGVTQAQVNISDLASGIYMMTVTADKGNITKKIVRN